MSGAKPPVGAAKYTGGGSSGSTYAKGSKEVSPDTFNLDLKTLAGVRIPGSLEMFGIQPVMGLIQGLDTKGGKLTARQTLEQFTTMDPQQRAQLQYKLYLAGYYPANYQPGLGGPLREEDVAAFRSFLVGVAANPSGGNITDMLDAAAQLGKSTGTKRAQTDPLTIQLTNPDDIRSVIQSGANAIFGKYLDPAQVEKFVQSYQAQEAAYQTDYYNSKGFDPSTGLEIQNPDGTRAVHPITQTAPATGAGEQRQFFDQMAATHPNETSAAIFTDKLDEMISALLGPKL